MMILPTTRLNPMKDMKFLTRKTVKMITVMSLVKFPTMDSQNDHWGFSDEIPYPMDSQNDHLDVSDEYLSPDPETCF